MLQEARQRKYDGHFNMNLLKDIYLCSTVVPRYFVVQLSQTRFIVICGHTVLYSIVHNVFKKKKKKILKRCHVVVFFH